MRRRTLERTLSGIVEFDDPRPSLEQYVTTPAVAASLLHRCALNGDIGGRVVVDLGTGTGRLALGAAYLDPARVIGLDRDPAAVAIARANEDRVDPPLGIDWVIGDAAHVPIPPGEATVVMNPPFGAQRESAGDRPFLQAAAEIGSVSYSLHNAESLQFLETFAEEHGGRLTHAYGVEMALERQFDFHTADRVDLEFEAVRIVWAHPPG